MLRNGAVRSTGSIGIGERFVFIFFAEKRGSELTGGQNFIGLACAKRNPRLRINNLVIGWYWMYGRTIVEKIESLAAVSQSTKYFHLFRENV